MAHDRASSILPVAVLVCFLSCGRGNVTTPSAATDATALNVAINHILELCPATNPFEEGKEFLDKFFSQIVGILRHFRNPEAVGLPGQTVLEDRLNVRNSSADLGVAISEFYDVTVHGLNNFTIEAVNVDFDGMQVYTMIKMKHVRILGHCKVDTIIGLKSEGPLNITLTNVTGESTVFLTVNPDGRLIANRSMSYITYEDLAVSSNSSMQALLKGAGVTILAALKPDILNQIDERVTQEVNATLKGTPRMPCGDRVSPIDLAIFEGRQFARQKYEPLKIEKVFEHESAYLAVRVGPLRLRGLSRFARVGKVTTSMVNRTVQFRVRIVTGRLLGQSEFFYDFGRVKAERSGVVNFTVERLQFEAKVNQSVDVCRRPILDDLQLEVGRVTVSLDGKGMLTDYLVELVAQYLPPLLRYVIVDALEEPIKNKIQKEMLDRLNMDELKLHFPPLMSACSSEY